MSNFTLALLSALALIGAAWASPSDEDFAQCEKRHSRETCIHSLLP